MQFEDFCNITKLCIRFCIKMMLYANMPLHYAEILKTIKMIFFYEKLEYFLIFAQNMDCGYTLVPPH